MKFNITSLFKIANRTIVTFSVFILTLSLLALFTGNVTQSISTMFQLGNKGLALSTIAQSFLISCTIAIEIFLIENYCKDWPTVYKAGLTFFAVILTAMIFIVIFDWFPINSILGWISFLASFLLFFTVSTFIMTIKVKKEDEEIQQLFNSYQKSKENKI